MEVVLTVTKGPHEGATYRFTEHDCFLVGRGSDAHFRLPQKDPHFSRRHFLIEVNPPLCRLSDMGSTNGTMVNGQRVTTADLRDGDVIEGGRTRICAAVKGGLALPQDEEVLSLAEIAAANPRLADVASRDACQSTGAWERKPEIEVHAADRKLLPDDYAAKARGRDQPFPGYQIIGELGQGAMGVVLLAVTEAGGRVVALKSVTPAAKGTAAELQRFLRELCILRELVHPHIASFRDLGTAGGVLFFAMEYVPGANVKQLLKEKGPMAVGRAVRLTCQLLEALDYAHGKGFVHRDVKPANLLVTPGNGDEALKLTDFGLARAYQATRFSGLTITGEIGGTIPFMAPEQVTHYRDVQPAADQYSAAATLYHMLTHRYVHEFPRDVGSQLALILQGEPVPIVSRRSEIPARLAAAIHRALARSPEDRFPNVAAFREALLPFRSEIRIRPIPQSSPRKR